MQVPEGLFGALPRIVCGSNPGGVGHEFVKSEFIDNKNPLEIYQMSDEEGGMTRQFIPAKLEDNPTMTENDPLYFPFNFLLEPYNDLPPPFSPST